MGLRGFQTQIAAIRTPSAARLLPLLLLFMLRANVQAQFFHTTNNGAITIMGYYGPGGAVTVPSAINGLPVASIADFAFRDNTSLTSVTIANGVMSIGRWAFQRSSLASVAIPGSVTNIGQQAFEANDRLTSVTIGNGVISIEPSAFRDCTSLLGATIPNSVTSIGQSAFGNCRSLTNLTISDSVTNIAYGTFAGCTDLTSVTIGDSVINIGGWAFWGCTGLTSVTIPASVASIRDYAFGGCTSLTTVYFQGDAPSPDAHLFEFSGDNRKTAYYLPGNAGWGTTFGGLPTTLWLPQMQTSDASFGMRTNQFGFNIAWASGQVVVIEACTNLAPPLWSPLQTNTLTGDSLYFSDPQWTNYPARFYRVRSP